MNLDHFTQRAQEAIAGAQALAERLQSPVLDAEHLLAALAEDDEGIPAQTLRRVGVDLAAFRGELAALLARRAKVAGGQLTLDARARRVLERASEEARRLGDEFVSTEHLLLGIVDVGGDGQALLERHGAGREALLGALAGIRGGQRVTERQPRGHVPGPGEVRPRPDPAGARRQARSGHRARRRDPAGHPGALAADQEQPGAHRRAGRRQDRHRRGAGPADRPRRRPGERSRTSGSSPWTSAR